MAYIDGMVGGLVQLVEYAHVSSRLGGCRENSKSELLLVHRLRAGESEQQTAPAYLPEGSGVQPTVAFQRVGDGIAVLGESRSRMSSI